MNFTIQQKKALDLNRNLVVTAGAGSGKTTILVERYLKILLNQPGTGVQNILAITFTDKAAQEMKQRVVEKLFELFGQRPALKSRLFEIIKSFPGARISTIHAFCYNVLKDYAIVSGIDSTYRLINAQEMREIALQTFWEFFYNYQPQNPEKKKLHLSALRAFEIKNLKDLFLEAYEFRNHLLPFIQEYAALPPDFLAGRWKILKESVLGDKFTQLWKNPEIPEILQTIIPRLKPYSTKKETALVKAGEDYLICLSDPQAEVSFKIRVTLDLLDALFTQAGTPYQALEKKTIKLGFQEKWERLIALTQPFFPDTELGAKDTPEQSAQYAGVLCGMCDLLLQYFDLLAVAKKKLQVLDFDDLLAETQKLLQNHPEILAELQKTYRWILVDEFQDTDIIQSDIIRMLAARPQNNLFIVGDPKQAIYGFRQADVTIFQQFINEIKKQASETLPFYENTFLEEIESTPEERLGVIGLPDNFRSAADLIAFYNEIFRKILTRESAFDVPFAALAQRRHTHTEIPTEIHFKLIEYVNLKKEQYENHEVAEVVATIRELVDSGKYFRLNDRLPEAHKEPLQWKDIAVLLRSRNCLPLLQDALQDAGIPYMVYQGVGYYQTREIKDVYYLLKAAAAPDDNFAVVSALRSAYIALSDIGLFYLSRCKGSHYLNKAVNLWSALENENLPEAFQDNFNTFLTSSRQTVEIRESDKNALEFVATHFPQWHFLAHRSQYSLLLNEIIETTHLSAILGTGEHGRQKKANLDKLIQFVYEYERTASGRMTDLLNTIEKLISGEIKEAEAPVYEETGNQVQIFTIHTAKGLEFPVVILPFLEEEFRFDTKVHFHRDVGFMFPGSSKNETFIYNYFKFLNRQKVSAEEKRLLYVACTRAQDHLILIGAREAKKNLKDCFLQMVSEALDIREDSATDPHDTRHLKISRRQIDENTPEPVYRSSDDREAGKDEGQEIEHIFEQIKLYQQQPLPRVSGEYSATQLMIFRENPERFIYHYYFKSGNIYPPQVEEEFEDPPGGLWWGTLIHKTLEHFQLRPAETDADYLHSLLLQMNIPATEHERLGGQLLAVLNAFRETDFARFLINRPQKSELRMAVKLPGGTLTGVLDRVFQNEEGIWEVVDFKSNQIREDKIPEMVKKYTPQMEYYALLMHQLFPQQTVFPVRLFFLSVMSDIQFRFSADQISEIKDEARKTIAALQKIENQFYNVSGRVKDRSNLLFD